MTTLLPVGSQRRVQQSRHKLRVLSLESLSLTHPNPDEGLPDSFDAGVRNESELERPHLVHATKAEAILPLCGTAPQTDTVAPHHYSLGPPADI